MTSVGTMLANGRGYLATDPYIIFFPALFISLLEVSFNLFGNGSAPRLQPFAERSGIRWKKKLQVRNLRISFRTVSGKVQAVRDISF